MTRKLCVLALFAITWGFYSWTARTNGKPFKFESRSNDYYNLLVDGFLQGHLYLPISPDPALLRTADPYDPEQNAPYRIHDASLYHGKFYLYFGAAPAVSLLLPFRWITNLRLPENLAVVLFLFSGLIVSYWTFQFIVQRFAPQTPGYFSYIAIVLLGFCNFAPYILRRPAFYELAIAGGYFYFWAAVYFLLTGIYRRRTSYWRLTAAGVCLGLTVASRPNYAIAVSGALCAAGMAMFWTRTEQARLKQWLALCLPFGCVLALLLTYNYLRFDHVFEFGQRFQLESFRMGKTFSPAYFAHNFRAYIYFASRIDRHFPFFHLLPQRAQIYTVAYGEPVGGALPTAPITGLVLLLIPIWVFLKKGRFQFDRSRPLVILATLFGACGLLMVLFLSFNGGLTERYVLDFIPSFLFSAILVWIILHQALQALLPYRRAMNVFLILLLLFQLTLNLAVSLTGYYDNLHEENPATYGKIRSFFSFIEP